MFFYSRQHFVIQRLPKVKNAIKTQFYSRKMLIKSKIMQIYNKK